MQIQDEESEFWIVKMKNCGSEACGSNYKMIKLVVRREREGYLGWSLKKATELAARAMDGN